MLIRESKFEDSYFYESTKKNLKMFNTFKGREIVCNNKRSPLSD